MATLTTGDIKTLDELSEISKDQLANEDSILTYDKDMSCHKKLTVAALKALMLENSNGAEASEAAAEASAEASAESAAAAAGSATSAANSASAAADALADLSGQAVLAESYAVGRTGSREGEDTDNARYYATEAEASASNAATAEEGASASATSAAASESGAATSASAASASASAAAASEASAEASEAAAALSEGNAATSEGNAASSAVLAESYAVGGTGSREGEDTDNASYYASQAAASAAAAMANGEAAAGAAEEVHDALSTGGVAGGHRTVIVTDDLESPADVDTTFRVQGDAALTIQDSAVFGTRVTVLNETDGPRNVILRLSTGSSVKTVPAGQSWLFVWTGYWNDGLGSSPEVTEGDLRPVTSDAVAQYKSDSVASGDMRPVTSDAVAGKFAGIGTIISGSLKNVTVPAGGSAVIGSITLPGKGLYVAVCSGWVTGTVGLFWSSGLDVYTSANTRLIGTSAFIRNTSSSSITANLSMYNWNATSFDTSSISTINISVRAMKLANLD